MDRKPRSGPYKELRVPCSVIRPHMDKFASQYEDAEGWWENNHERGWMCILGSRIGKSAKTIRRIHEGKYETSLNGERHYVDHIPFDLADKVICETSGPIAWRMDPELAKHYGPLPVRGYERKRAA